MFIPSEVARSATDEGTLLRNFAESGANHYISMIYTGIKIYLKTRFNYSILKVSGHGVLTVTADKSSIHRWAGSRARMNAWEEV